MNTTIRETAVAENLSEAARTRLLSRPGEPFFIADWIGLYFCHFEIPAEVLQPQIPFTLDTFQGRAFISLVSFQLDHLRLYRAQGITAPLFRPFTRSHFLNVRTYVTHDGEPGIYFMQEYLSNRLSLPFGPPTYGLPYHYAAAERRIDARTGNVELTLNGAKNHQLKLHAKINNNAGPHRCAPGSLAEFLLERYTAYTCHHGIKRRFRIWHQPWQQRPVDFQITNQGLLPETWLPHAEAIGGNTAAIGHNVWMGKPVLVG